MRYAAVIVLTLCQFTVFPFLAMVSANTARQQEQVTHDVGAQADNAHNSTVVYKSATM